MEKLNGTSMNIVQDNIEKLKQIFPEVFLENKIDFETLQQLLGKEIDVEQERYSFNWHGKSNARRIAQEQSTGTLLPSKEDSKNWDNTNNLYIEGDNLEVLKLLQKSYHNKVKMIYIDPPYNTGKDFVYPDNFKDNLKNYLEITGQTGEEGQKLSTNSDSSGRYHSDWLNMMYPRLKLARNLLTDDGVIFISLDDYEEKNLTNLCDEIFGENNKLQKVIWQRHSGGGNDSKFFAVDHEYILVYTKNKDKIDKIRIPLDDEDIKDYRFKDEYFETLGPYKTKDFKRMRPDDPRPTLRYEIIAPDGTKLFDEWRWEKEKFEREYSQNKVLIEKNTKNEWSVKYKLYLKSNDEGDEKQKVPRSLLTKIEKNSQGKKALTNILGGKDLFNNPKPIGLLKYLLNMRNPDSLILDFFSGSATTAHATMQLNAEDGGNRRYIMVQLPEPTPENSEAAKAGYKNICEIGKERIRRAGEKIKADETLPLENREKLDTGFKVFKLDTSNIKEWDSETTDLKQSLFDSVDNIKSDRTSLDVLYEILLKYGLDLNVPIVENKDFYSIGGGTLLVNLNKTITLDVIDSISKEYKMLLEIDEDYKTTVVLRDSSFKNDIDKTNAIQKLKQAGIKEIRSI